MKIFAYGLRLLRGWWYRRLPAFLPGCHRKRMAGFGRRWNLEVEGWTQEGFSRIFFARVLCGRRRGRILELGAGDGLVGSLGRWLEDHQDWTATCEEPRDLPFAQLKGNRPKAECIQKMDDSRILRETDLVTCRSGRRCHLVVRLMRKNGFRPRVLGLWNRSRRAAWAQRLRALGYHPILCQDRMEFYRLP